MVDVTTMEVGRTGVRPPRDGTRLMWSKKRDMPRAGEEGREGEEKLLLSAWPSSMLYERET